MSSRQLRRLQQQRELAKAQQPVADQAEDDEDDEVPAAASKPRPNLFAALGDEDEDASQDDDDDDQAAQGVSQLQPEAGDGENKIKKQQQKKKKKKKKKTVKGKADLDEADKATEQDEIDKALKELRIDLQNKNTDSNPDTGEELPLRTKELCGINTHHLRPLNEMMNIFGREVIQSEYVREQEASEQRMRAQAQQHVDLEMFLREPPGALVLSEVSLRRNPFVLDEQGT
ncbi:hypothetical protein XA68_14895 [Ophiocordyceps unilateralis]|uniref:Uncharacterized protein n=1 Tax=Ophiocordyceps unilateralis TaxID=268505 RepID=A0A2A9P9C8_OPHUN|nr:hypothetical protein XA68_14895 [Ophiocordyceps unilateralis]